MSDSIVVRDLVDDLSGGFKRQVQVARVFMIASSMFYPVEPLPTPLRQLSWANPITWHVDVLRYATIGVGQPSIIWLESSAFLVFTVAAFAGVLWALKQQ